jgi:hypothetical protein
MQTCFLYKKSFFYAPLVLVVDRTWDKGRRVPLNVFLALLGLQSGSCNLSRRGDAGLHRVRLLRFVSPSAVLATLSPSFDFESARR